MLEKEEDKKNKGFYPFFCYINHFVYYFLIWLLFFSLSTEWSCINSPGCFCTQKEFLSKPTSFIPLKLTSFTINFCSTKKLAQLIIDGFSDRTNDWNDESSKATEKQYNFFIYKRDLSIHRMIQILLIFKRWQTSFKKIYDANSPEKTSNDPISVPEKEH